MTEKELLYIEDAISHEENVIAYLSHSLNHLEDTLLLDFFEKEIVCHNKMKNSFMKLLREGSCD